MSLSIIRAANFAALKHCDQRRKDATGTPYINHPLGVMELAADVGGVTDEACLQACVLHDVLEDTDCSVAEMRHRFGDEVTDIVLECTDDKSLPKCKRKMAQIEHAPHMTARGKTVKLADKLYNLRDLAANRPPAWSRARAQGYFVWAWHVIAGLRGTNAGLEKMLDAVFEGDAVDADGAYPVLVEGEGLAGMLEEYLREMEIAGLTEDD